MEYGIRTKEITDSGIRITNRPPNARTSLSLVRMASMEPRVLSSASSASASPGAYSDIISKKVRQAESSYVMGVETKCRDEILDIVDHPEWPLNDLDASFH